MSLMVYNTLTRKKEEFVPLEYKRVKAYVCGVTLYDQLHLGHARYAVVFDVIRKYLEYKGYEVNYITNFTDIDDKMISRAQSLGVSVSELAEKFITEYFAQMQQLGIKKANCHPRATEHIKEIVQLIKKLENRGLAYSVDGDVFFRVRKFSSYGKLSGQNLEDVLVGVRVEVEEKKENPLDFVLWKKSKENEPSWDSPWGKGRPGWHVECSAMAMKYLGENLDIHGGGKDLIFPHHENEIAQSEGATRNTFVKYWLHNGLVRMKDAKMSKSTGNFFTLSSALNDYGGEIVRYFLLSAHYRSPLNYSKNSLEKAATSLKRIHNTLRKIEELGEERTNGLLGNTSIGPIKVKAKADELLNCLKEAKHKLTRALDDDFNVPIALSVIFELTRKANLLLGDGKYLDDSSFQILSKTYQKIKTLGNILGLLQGEKEKELEGKEDQLIELFVNIRETLREGKQWELADKIRKGLDRLGIKLEDKENRTVWRVN